MCVYFIYFIGLVKNYNFINKSLLKKKNCISKELDVQVSQNGALTVHYGVVEITVNVTKMFKKFCWTYLLIWGHVTDQLF
jgi:hypothetical protein